MDPINGGVAVFNYKGDSTKVGGIRYQGAYKMVFLGIGIEMISDAAVRDEVVKLSYRWFNDLISVEEFDAAMKKLNVYPNPSEGQVTIPNLMENESYTISVFDVLGKKVFEETKTTLENHLKMDFKELASGSYTLKVSGKELNYSASLILK